MTSTLLRLPALWLPLGAWLARCLARIPALRKRLPLDPGPASPHRTRLWVCVKHRTDGRPCCALGNGGGSAAELLAALERELAIIASRRPDLAARIDLRPSSCLDLCDHALVAIAHTGPVAHRLKPPKHRLDRLLHPCRAQFTGVTPGDAPQLLQILLELPPQSH